MTDVCQSQFAVCACCLLVVRKRGARRSRSAVGQKQKAHLRSYPASLSRIYLYVLSTNSHRNSFRGNSRIHHRTIYLSDTGPHFLPIFRILTPESSIVSYPASRHDATSRRMTRDASYARGDTALWLSLPLDVIDANGITCAYKRKAAGVLSRRRLASVPIPHCDSFY